MVDQKKDGQQPTDQEAWGMAQDEQDKKIDGMIEGKFGQETLDSLDSSTDLINSALKQGLLKIENDPATVDEFTTVAREFSRALFARLNSTNLRPGSAINALEEATDLMAPESRWDSSPRATKALKALNDSRSSAE